VNSPYKRNAELTSVDPLYCAVERRTKLPQNDASKRAKLCGLAETNWALCATSHKEVSKNKLNKSVVSTSSNISMQQKHPPPPPT
jgi:hypothetical protein